MVWSSASILDLVRHRTRILNPTEIVARAERTAQVMRTWGPRFSWMWASWYPSSSLMLSGKKTLTILGAGCLKWLTRVFWSEYMVFWEFWTDATQSWKKDGEAHTYQCSKGAEIRLDLHFQFKRGWFLGSWHLWQAEAPLRCWKPRSWLWLVRVEHELGLSQPWSCHMEKIRRIRLFFWTFSI